MTGLKLSIGRELILPLDAATETFGILAKKGAGKSNAAVVLAEEFFQAGIPWVAVDPKGDYWGVRSSADGRSAGMPVVVFGGRHGDVPLEPTAGALIADLILGDDGRGYLSCVLDVSQFTLGEQRRFLLDFGERLFRQKDEERVLHLIMEEAHEYLPQMVPRESARLVSTWQRIVKQGRFKGLGVTLVSQRSAALNKDVLTQVGSLIVMRTTGPQDRKAIKGWVEGTDVPYANLLTSLPSLKPGDAWLWSPELYDEAVAFTFRRRRTFDSGATPKVGQAKVVPRTLADVDLGAIKDAMAETIEKAKADDPRELRKLILTQDREIARLKVEMHRLESRRVEVPVLDRVEINALRAHVESLSAVVGAALTDLGTELNKIRNIGDLITQGLDKVQLDAPAKPPEKPVPAPRVPWNPQPKPEVIPGTVSLDKAGRAILSLLAQFPEGRTNSQLALLSGYSPKASTIGVALSKLRQLEYVTRGGIPKITEAGRAVAVVEPLPQGDALLDYWLNHTSLDKAAKLVLRLLVEIYPNETDYASLAHETNYSPTASTIGVAMSRLRKLELAEGWRASPTFMEAIGR